MGRLIILLIALLFPQATLAYRVPERDHWRTYTLHLINRSREEHGLSAIGIDEELNNLAQAHAEDTAIHFDDSTDATRRAYLEHTSSDGRDLGDRIEDQGIEGASAYGENVGYRWARPFTDIHLVLEDSLDEMHGIMMAEVPPDDGHRKTILGDYTHVGIGLELHRNAGSEVNTILFVTDFGKFGAEREKNIPELGSRPGGSTTRTPARTDRTSRSRRRTRIREIDSRTRRVAESVAEQLKNPGSSWAERNTQRLSARRNERLQRLQERVNTRKLERLRRRDL